MPQKNTKIVCTLGPSSDSVKEIVNLINAGMDVARLNFSHGTYEHHSLLINNIHKAEKITGKRIGILQDLQGPKIRIGEMPEEGIKLEQNEELDLSIKNIIGEKKKKKIVIPVKYKNLIKDVKKGHAILVDDGLIEIKVLSIKKTFLHCKVINGGVVKKNKGINFPNSTITQKTITDKDLHDLEFGLNHQVDFVALSFVKSKEDIINLRKLIQAKKSDTSIIAKIERHEAVGNMREIIKAADGVMVARGDLGADIPPEKVPIVQKEIIAQANKYGKPVITATQVLYSMVKNPRATRAEISDAANAVYDHTDAIMLSNETAVGKFAEKATETLKNVALNVEREMKKHQELLENLSSHIHNTNIDATCLNACELAKDCNADLLVIYTETPEIAQNIAKHRLYLPIIILSNSEKVAQKLTLVWGINQVYVIDLPKTTSQKTEKIIDFLKKHKIIEKGQKVVIVCNIDKKEKLITSYQT